MKILAASGSESEAKRRFQYCSKWNLYIAKEQVTQQPLRPEMHKSVLPAEFFITFRFHWSKQLGRKPHRTQIRTCVFCETVCSRGFSSLAHVCVYSLLSYYWTRFLSCSHSKLVWGQGRVLDSSLVNTEKDHVYFSTLKPTAGHRTVGLGFQDTAIQKCIHSGPDMQM